MTRSLPALPPAPTSIVRNKVTTRWSRSSCWYWSSTREEVDCSTRRPSSQRLRMLGGWVLVGAA